MIARAGFHSGVAGHVGRLLCVRNEVLWVVLRQGPVATHPVVDVLCQGRWLRFLRCVGGAFFGISRAPPRHVSASPVQCSTVQYSTVQYSTVQYSAVQYSTVQYSAVQCSTVQYSAVQCSAVQCSAVQYSAVQCASVQ